MSAIPTTDMTQVNAFFFLGEAHRSFHDIVGNNYSFAFSGSCLRKIGRVVVCSISIATLYCHFEFLLLWHNRQVPREVDLWIMNAQGEPVRVPKETLALNFFGMALRWRIRVNEHEIDSYVFYSLCLRA